MNLAHARVAADDESEVVWAPERSTLTLSAGRIDVAVDPGAKRPFRVATALFTIEVAGTAFLVDGEGVRVTQGTVRVLAPESEQMLAEVHAGQAWNAGEHTVSSHTPLYLGRGAASAADTGSSTTPPSRGTVAAAELASNRSEPALARPVSDLLSQARSHLAAGAVAKAERDVSAALQGKPSRSEAAEAKSLLAECALVNGNPDRAARLYVEVNRENADLPAGETALFAAARIQVNAGRRVEAEALLRSYLDKYSQGRFRQEASSRLQAIRRSEHP